MGKDEMTEERWLETNTARELIDYVAERVSDRKLRLFACAACRRILSVMQYEASRKTVELCEGFADEQVEWDELLSMVNEAKGLADTAERLQLAGWNAART